MRMSRLFMLVALAGSLWFSRTAIVQAEECYDDYCCDGRTMTIYPFYPGSPPPDLCDVEQSTLEEYCENNCQSCGAGYAGGGASCGGGTITCQCGLEND
jgi:hypothetical protein